MEKWVQSFSENSMIQPCLNSKKKMWGGEGRRAKKHISVDSSGLRINRKSSRWYSMRTHSNIVKKRDFRKLHLASECRHKEKPIYSWELTSAIRHDSPRFRKLLIRITGELGDVYGDKTYSSRENAELTCSRERRQTFFNAKKQRVKQSYGTPSMERNDELLGRASRGIQKQ